MASISYPALVSVHIQVSGNSERILIPVEEGFLACAILDASGCGSPPIFPAAAAIGTAGTKPSSSQIDPVGYRRS